MNPPAPSPRLALLASLLDLTTHRSYGCTAYHAVFRGSLASFHAALARLGVHHDWFTDEDGPAVGLMGLNVRSGGMGGVQVEDLPAHDEDPGVVHGGPPAPDDIPPAVRSLILQVIDESAIPRWYDTPIASLGSRSPREAVQAGDIDRLMAVLGRAVGNEGDDMDGMPGKGPGVPPDASYAIATPIVRGHEVASYGGKTAGQGVVAAYRHADGVGRDAERP